MNDEFKPESDLQKFIEIAPPQALAAYENRWENLVLYPDGYTTLDFCECCTSGHAPGWYGRNPKLRPGSAWMWICGPTGEVERPPKPAGITCC